MKLFCAHEWKLISEHTSKSRFEHVIENLKGIKGNLESVSMPPGMSNANRTVIQIVACSKCGKIKKFKSKV